MKGKRASIALLLAPSLVGVLALYVVPLIWGSTFAVWSPAQGFLGARALRDTMANDMFRQGLGNTLLLLVTAVPLTLAQAEKVVGVKQFNELLKDYIVKKPGKPALAKESDKRPAISGKPKAIDIFENI